MKLAIFCFQFSWILKVATVASAVIQGCSGSPCPAADHPTTKKNFTITNLPAAQAAPYVETAERCRRELALYWTGKELPGNWASPCPIGVTHASHSGGGATTFSRGMGQVFNWNMNVSGTLGPNGNVILDVIPHEVNHCVFHSLFADLLRSIPRWIDEGAAGHIESERSHTHARKMLRGIMDSGVYIPVRNLVRTDYSPDSRETMLLYNEGFSLTEFIVQRDGPTGVLKVIREGVGDPGALENDWREWFLECERSGYDCQAFGCTAPHSGYFTARPPSLIGVGANVGPVGLDMGLSVGGSQGQQQQGQAGQLQAVPPMFAALSNTATGKPAGYLFTDGTCTPCKKFQGDYDSNAGGLRAAIDGRYTLTKKNPAKDRELAKSLKISSVPTFVVADGSLRIVGYEGPEKFIAELGPAGPKKFERSSVSVNVNTEGMPGPPPRLFDDPPSPIQIAGIGQASAALGITAQSRAGIFEPDWVNVDVVVCLPEGSLGERIGKVADLAKRYGVSRNTVPIGELESMVAELTQGKARVHVVTERFSPVRFGQFTAVVGMAGVEAPVLAAFVGQEATGVKGAVVGLLEKLAKNKIGDISIAHARLLTVFERVEATKYNDTLAAISASEPTPAPSSQDASQPSGLTSGSDQDGAGLASPGSSQPANGKPDNDSPTDPIKMAVGAAIGWLLMQLKKLRGEK